MRRMYDRKFSVHRENLKRMLGTTDRMPADFAGRWEGVTLPGCDVIHPAAYDDKGRIMRADVPGTWTVVVKTGDEVKDPRRARNYSAHRVFVVGKCGKEIPAGRLAQHAPNCEHCKG